MPQERAASLPNSDSPASRVEVGVSLSRSTPGQHSMSPGPWLVLPHCVSHRKWTHSRRVRRSPEKSGLDFVKEQLATPQQSYDVDTLLHVHQQSVHAAQDSHWLWLVTIAACSVTVMVLLFFLLRARLQLLWSRCWRVKTGPSPIAGPRGTTAPDAMLEHGEAGTRSQDPQKPVAFSTYGLRTD